MATEINYKSSMLALRILRLSWPTCFLFHCKHGFKKTVCIRKIITYT